MESSHFLFSSGFMMGTNPYIVLDSCTAPVLNTSGIPFIEGSRCLKVWETIMPMLEVKDTAYIPK